MSNSIPSYDNRTSPTNLHLKRLEHEKHISDLHENVRRVYRRRRVERIINRQNEINDIKMYDKKLQIKFSMLYMKVYIILMIQKLFLFYSIYVMVVSRIIFLFKSNHSSFQIDLICF